MIKPAALVAAGAAVGIAVAPASIEAAVNYFDRTSVVSGTTSVVCPSGYKVSGGGVASLPNDYTGQIESEAYAVTGSFPYRNGWRATAKVTYGSYDSTNGWRYTTYQYPVRAYAVCVN